VTGRKVKAAVLRSAPGKLEIEELAIDAPGAREVLVRTVHAGLCHSDLHFIEGRFPHPLPVVMGHEAAGVVEAVGSEVGYVRPGDHVITCLSSFCGECRSCLRGRTYLCMARPGLQRATPPLHGPGDEPVHAAVGLGAFAEQMVVHERALAKIREDMPLDVASLLGCGVTTGLGAALRTAKVEPGSSAAVIGCGGIGLAAVQGARLAGASQIVAVDVAADKLDRARTVGATHVVDASAGDAVEAVRVLTGGGVDFSFEAIGLKRTAEQAFAMLRPGGVATVIGMVPPTEVLEIRAADLYMMDKRVQGSNMGSNRFRLDMPWYCDLYLDGRLKLDELVTAHRPLEEVNEGYEDLRNGVGLRTVLDIGAP
jgi:S-(hydroxymethyl)glutathione dehydrogenase/alcohol dehydrogenase